MNQNSEELGKSKGSAISLSKKPTNAWSNPLKSVHIAKLPKQVPTSNPSHLPGKGHINLNPRILPQPITKEKSDGNLIFMGKYCIQKIKVFIIIIRQQRRKLENS